MLLRGLLCLSAPAPFAVIDQKEYRYYFEGNCMIRRISPEGTVSDNPLKGMGIRGMPVKIFSAV